jgi:hypothetical protein
VPQPANPASQPFPQQMPQQAGPYPQQSYPGYQQQPVRLRPPMPAGSSSFTKTSSGGAAKWIVPVLVGVALLVIVLLFVVMATSGSGSSSGSTPSTAELPTSVPTAGG